MSAISLVTVPIVGILSTCLIAIVSPVIACVLAVSLESREQLLRRLE